MRSCERCGDPTYEARRKCREPGCGLRICAGCRDVADVTAHEYRLIDRCADHGPRVIKEF